MRPVALGNLLFHSNALMIVDPRGTFSYAPAREHAAIAALLSCGASYPPLLNILSSPVTHLHPGHGGCSLGDHAMFTSRPNFRVLSERLGMATWCGRSNGAHLF